MALNCLSSCARSSAFSASACAFSLAARSRSAWLAALCASFSRFRRSASARPQRPRLVLQLQAVRFGCGSSHARVILCLQAIRFGSGGSHARVILALQPIGFRESGRCLRILFACQALRFRLRLDPRLLGFACDAIRLGLRGNPCALRARFALRRLLPLRGQGIFLLTFDSDGPRVFRHLHCFPGSHGYRLPAGLALLVGFGLGQALLGLLKGLGGKAVGTHGARDLNGVARFVEFQRQLLIDLQRQRVRQTLILAALQSSYLASISSIFPFVSARTTFSITIRSLGRVTAVVGFGGDDQAEHLQLGGDVQLALRSVQKDLAQVGRAAFGRDGPQHICQVFGPFFVAGCRPSNSTSISM